MDIEITNQLKEWFNEYVRSFISDDEEIMKNITLKERHSRRVSAEALYIGRNLGLEDEKLRIAEIIGLFHDIGRFEQYTKYRTFVDQKSINHAEFGVQILNNKGILNILENKVKDIILTSILYHNRAALPVIADEEYLLYTKLIRDADKLDIWRVLIDYYENSNGKRNAAIELDLPNTPGYSEEIYQSILNRTLADFRRMKNLNDFKLLHIGWVYDINYKPTFRRIFERGYIDKFRNLLPQSSEIEILFKNVNNYLNYNIN